MEPAPTPAAEPDESLVAAFWTDARVRSGLAGEEVYLGRSSHAVLPPPAWCFGDSRETADRLCDLVLDGVKTATASARWEYDAAGESLPEPGEVSILCDGSGTPRALVRVTRVRLVPFGEVDAAHAAAEGEGDGSLDSWRDVHHAFFARNDDGTHPVTDDTEVVLEDFEVLVRA